MLLIFSAFTVKYLAPKQFFVLYKFFFAILIFYIYLFFFCVVGLYVSFCINNEHVDSIAIHATRILVSLNLCIIKIVA